jgi:hypothetical protein
MTMMGTVRPQLQVLARDHDNEGNHAAKWNQTEQKQASNHGSIPPQDQGSILLPISVCAHYSTVSQYCVALVLIVSAY